MEVPPKDFVLQGHHVGILSIFMLTFKDLEGRLPPPFLLHVLRLLLQESIEIAPLRSFAEIYQDLVAGPKSEDVVAASLIQLFDTAREKLNSAEELHNFFAGIPTLFVDKGEIEEDATSTATLHRRSVFGFFCRRCFLSFLKLSFNGVGKLQKEYEAWGRGTPILFHEFPMIKADLHNDTQIFRTSSDKISWAQPGLYARWQASLSAGDEHAAIENLRKYFEQHFHDNDLGFRQHALLNLVRMHYLRQEFGAAQTLLSEAIGVARTNNDKVTLAYCVTLQNRLPPKIEGRRPVLNQIQADVHPLEILFDVTKLMDEQNNQPLSASFEKIIQATGVLDHWLDNQPIAPRDSDQWAQHAVQSVVWSAAGCERIAAIEENIVAAFTDVGGSDNNRITTILNQAYREARQGHYEKSLAALLHPNVWRSLSLVEYGQWAQEIWHILVLWATRRGQDRAYRDILLPRKPPGEYKTRHYLLDTEGIKLPKIEDPLWEVIQMQHCGQAANTMDGLLTSLWHAEFLGRLNVYRTGMILFADVGKAFGMTKRSRKMMEDIMPQIILGTDLEQRALGCFTMARSIIVAEDEPKPEALEKALPYFLQAEQDYVAISMHQAVMDVQYFLAIVYENMGRRADSEEAARRHFATEALLKEVGALSDGFGEVMAAVQHVGVKLATRWSPL